MTTQISGTDAALQQASDDLHETQLIAQAALAKAAAACDAAQQMFEDADAFIKTLHASWPLTEKEHQ
jgi:hypothetical protein